MSQLPLDQQRVIITGAGQGLGAAIARAFAAKGADLILLDINADNLKDVSNQLGRPVACHAVDLSDANATQTSIDEIFKAGDRIDTLVHNAAILKPEPLGEVTLPTFNATMNVGIQAGFLLSKAAWPSMLANGGALIFVSSQSGIKGFADETAYCAAKHALEGFSKCLALEGADNGIVSCTITPGKEMHTPMSERTYPPELRKTWVEPDVLAPAFLEIAHTRNSAFNGTRLNAWDMVKNPEGIR